MAGEDWQRLADYVIEVGEGGGRKIRKSSTGFHLKQLFMGHQGTLGIVTRAVLRLRPRRPRPSLPRRQTHTPPRNPSAAAPRRAWHGGRLHPEAAPLRGRRLSRTSLKLHQYAPQ